MLKKFLLLPIILLSPLAFAQESKKDEVKTVSGISIVGNDEAPKSLFIVPWKSSEIGFESELAAQALVDGSLKPLDKDVFNRELDYFDIRSGKLDQ
ncbi:hypothetical protein [Halioxenophilus sp. WMMB6]|uniref:hypothetical protein n=1 Tax=Halioxenophilus sp. WMMB6 TaxID=3073815 RepID=UPI00295EAD78|nr:hypothetical protein [Halioxenophilus sp. WMMB6]